MWNLSFDARRCFACNILLVYGRCGLVWKVEEYIKVFWIACIHYYLFEPTRWKTLFFSVKQFLYEFILELMWKLEVWLQLLQNLQSGVMPIYNVYSYSSFSAWKFAIIVGLNIQRMNSLITFGKIFRLWILMAVYFFISLILKKRSSTIRYKISYSDPPIMWRNTIAVFCISLFFGAWNFRRLEWVFSVTYLLYTKWVKSCSLIVIRNKVFGRSQ